jgi:HEAT repeat protein
VIGGLGPEGKAVSPALVAALSDRDLAVRAAAASALRKIDPEAADRAGVP